MADVDVHIGGWDYRLSCDDGQEARLKTLAEEFDHQVSNVLEKQQLAEREALLVAALAVLDAFDEARQRWADMTPEGAAAEWVAEKLDRASERLEKALTGGKS